LRRLAPGRFRLETLQVLYQVPSLDQCRQEKASRPAPDRLVLASACHHRAKEPVWDQVPVRRWARASALSLDRASVSCQVRVWAWNPETGQALNRGRAWGLNRATATAWARDRG